MAESLGVAGTLEAAVAVLRTRLPVQSPVAAIVLGSGLGGLAHRIDGATRVTSMTSWWWIGCGLVPAAGLVMQLTAAQRIPMARPTTTSGTVDIPTASAPIRSSMRTSAGVSYVGPSSPQ